MNTPRYFELDWLRVMLIFAVFLHHVFMPFNGDGWHIMNNDSSKLLDDIMVYFEQLRLPTLFFIAGAGSFLLLSKVDSTSFISSKVKRLLLPLMIGMMFVVPPQNYFENIGQYSSFTEAYRQLMFSFDANHLWFIEFLIVFMLLAIPIAYFIRSVPGTRLTLSLAQLVQHKHGFFVIGLLLVAIRAVLKLYYPSQDGKIENISVSLFYLFFFAMGMIFISQKDAWAALAKHRRTHLAWFVFSSLLFYAYYFKPDVSLYLSLETRWQLWWLVCSLVSWSGLLTLMGYASAKCSSTPNWLKQANELIYPFYILHQTVIVWFAFYIVSWQASIAVKSSVLLITSLMFCTLFCYFVIRPIAPLRLLFGLKPSH